ncbi:MAG: ribonuclease H-like domain-containing protein [Methanoregula sp.]|nr:ribonuclease H-like domain-containing protein [Methanoregula sp.]
MAALQASARIGSLWHQRTQTLKDYEVVRDGNIFGAGFSNSVIFSSEYDRARQQLDHLVDRYHDRPFEAVFSGKEHANDCGTCFSLMNPHPLHPPAFDLDHYRNTILRDLTLVRGIGRATEKRLRARGYQTLPDLVEHPKYRMHVQPVIDCLCREDSHDIMELVGKRHAKSHPLVLGVAGLHEPEDYVFLDIETMGLFSRPIILFGIGVMENGALNVYQYLLRDIAEEPAALYETIRHLSGKRKALVTFNGKAFDLPYLNDRLGYYGMSTQDNSRIPHFDILHFSRRRWRDQYPSLRLTALEREILHIYREDDIPGQMVPEFYETYLRTGNCGPLVPIVEHNRQDIISLALLFFHLIGESYGC